jgi:ATP-dependent DNA helicase MPH1
LSDYINQYQNGDKRRTNFYNENGEFIKSLLNEIDMEMKLSTYSGHPKLDRLESIILQHFTDDIENRGETRVMFYIFLMFRIFSEFRDSVDEIVKLLEKHKPLLKPKSFVGQMNKKRMNSNEHVADKKGITQKQQMDVIEKFHRGEYNVLVATCIGEGKKKLILWQKD